MNLSLQESCQHSSHWGILPLCYPLLKTLTLEESLSLAVNLVALDYATSKWYLHTKPTHLKKKKIASALLIQILSASLGYCHKGTLGYNTEANAECHLLPWQKLQTHKRPTVCWYFVSNSHIHTPQLRIRTSNPDARKKKCCRRAFLTS